MSCRTRKCQGELYNECQCTNPGIQHSSNIQYSSTSNIRFIRSSSSWGCSNSVSSIPAWLYFGCINWLCQCIWKTITCAPKSALFTVAPGGVSIGFCRSKVCKDSVLKFFVPGSPRPNKEWWGWSMKRIPYMDTVWSLDFLGIRLTRLCFVSKASSYEMLQDATNVLALLVLWTAPWSHRTTASLYQVGHGHFQHFQHPSKASMS